MRRYILFLIGLLIICSCSKKKASKPTFEAPQTIIDEKLEKEPVDLFSIGGYWVPRHSDDITTFLKFTLSTLEVIDYDVKHDKILIDFECELSKSDHNAFTMTVTKIIVGESEQIKRRYDQKVLTITKKPYGRLWIQSNPYIANLFERREPK